MTDPAIFMRDLLALMAHDSRIRDRLKTSLDLDDSGVAHILLGIYATAKAIEVENEDLIDLMYKAVNLIEEKLKNKNAN